MTRRNLSPEEARAWARVAATVKPIGPRADDLEELSAALGSGGRDLDAAPAAASVRPRKPAAPRAPAPAAERSGEKKVRRGKLTLAARFDLHGHTQASASRALPAFLESQQTEGARCVLVITGKGKEGQGVLRRNFLLWLDSPPARRLVSGYAESHPKHGGAGAFYVFLRRKD
ncbi:MAG: DNA mismatch repair protein MutS [Hyphomonas sp.]|uniref:Smr/MutS family protein n=1 Tax=Hyphomonas sp. TaxID=87 RepID=UPI0017BC7353|nr:Smr/MutS family protein [Hyphomonas sp.]MBU3920085.1 Smr/MutS family protein [Alphaproteobacteria bacterium]MBA3070476.1 DNA mismatch repair protein MutS [Hyphomonas sp.]MBU4062006.1 Smr/MutS family protein [Alphaproteobacteria bacterium]MBU4164942.1 Smr/MutS family protein [Alphaproteobacteria bacterium]MBU4567857.1 Smr/MutS family protein [Alphaproteobacteria bacterium]